MNPLIENTITFLLTQSAHILFLFACVALACFVFRKKTAHLRYLLWLIIIAKCLLPSLITVPLAILPAEQQVVQGTEEAVIPAEYSLAPIEVPYTAVTTYKAVEETTPVVPAEQTIADQLVQVPPKTYLALSWLAGMILFLVFVLVKAVRLNLLFRQKRIALTSRLVDETEQILKSYDLKANFYLLRGIGQPFVWGLVKGSVYLPENFTKTTTPARRRAIIAHELAHIKRFDALVNSLQILAQGIFWFHPFVWIANKLIRAEREKACDETAIAKLAACPKDYSSAIVDTLIAEYNSTMPVPSLAVAGPVKNIEDRIKTVMTPGKKFYTRPTFIALAAILLLASVIVPTTIALTKRTPQPNHVVTGKVTDADTGEPIEGTVVSDGTYGPAQKQNATTDAQGMYELKTWNEEHNISANADGYQTQKQTLKTFPFDNSKNFNFQLKKLTISEFSSYKTILPNGVSVELLGLSYIPIKDQPWWKADGSVLEPAPFDSVSLNPSQDPERDKYKYFAFAFQMAGAPPKDITQEWRLNVATHIGNVEAYRNHKKIYGSDILAASARVPKEIESADLEVGLAAGPWKTIASGKGHKTYKNGTDLIVVDEPILIGGPGGLLPMGPGTYISVKYNIKDREFRVVAVDTDGNIHLTKESGRWLKDDLWTGNRAFPGLTEENFKEFQFQTRDFYWTKFKNVSLVPNQKTKPTIEVQKHQPIPEPETKNSNFSSTLPDGTTVELVGLCKYINPQDTWWRPDGQIFDSKMKIAEYDKYINERRTAFIIKCNVQDYDIKFNAKDVQSTAFLDVLDSDGNRLWYYYSAVPKIPEGLSAINFQLGIATGPWQTVTEFDGVRHATGDYVFTKPFETQDGTVISVTGEFDSSGVRRFVALDKSGKVHNGSWSGRSSNQLTIATGYFHNIKSDQIVTYKIEYRPYQFLEFKNVSLVPGKNTKPTIEIEKSQPTLKSETENPTNDLQLKGWEIFLGDRHPEWVYGRFTSLNDMNPENLITVRCIDSEGDGIPYCRIVFVDRDENETRRFIDYVPTNMDGYAYCDAINGPFSIIAQVFGYSQSMEAWWHQYKKMETLYDTKEKPAITVEWDSFPEGDGKILGNVSDQHGRPLNEYDFILTWREGQQEGWEELYVREIKKHFVDSKGRFEIKNLPEGTYTYYIYPKEQDAYVWDFNMGQVTVAEHGDATQLNIEIEAKDVSLKSNKDTKNEMSSGDILSYDQLKEAIKINRQKRTALLANSTGTAQMAVKRTVQGPNNQKQIQNNIWSTTWYSKPDKHRYDLNFSKQEESQPCISPVNIRALVQYGERVYYDVDTGKIITDKKTKVAGNPLGFTQAFDINRLYQANCKFDIVELLTLWQEQAKPELTEEYIGPIRCIKITFNAKGRFEAWFAPELSYSVIRYRSYNERAGRLCLHESYEGTYEQSEQYPGTWLLKELIISMLTAAVDWPVVEEDDLEKLFVNFINTQVGVDIPEEIFTENALKENLTIKDTKIEMSSGDDAQPSYPCSVYGKVTDHNGEPIANATVQIREIRKPGQSSIAAFDVETDQNGYYRYDKIEWLYTVGAIWKEKIADSNDLHRQYIRINKIFGDDQKVDFQFKPFKAGTGSLSGRVTDRNGLPVTDFIVHIANNVNFSDYSTDYLHQYTFTQTFSTTDGSFKVDNLPEGKYSVNVYNPKLRGYEWPRRNVIIEQGNTADINLEVLRIPQYFGRILFEDGTPAVVDSIPWLAEISVSLREGDPPTYTNSNSLLTHLDYVDEQGYFTAYLTNEKLNQLRSEKASINISYPSSEEKNLSLSIAVFPVELLSKDKAKAGTIKIKRPSHNTNPNTKTMGSAAQDALLRRMKSMEHLKRFGTACYLYADDNDDNLPGNIQQLKPYLETDTFNWITDNIEYMNKGKLKYIQQPAFTAIAYDKTMLKENHAKLSSATFATNKKNFLQNHSGTTVAFADGHVEYFASIFNLEQLGIQLKQIAIEVRLMLVSEKFLEDIGLSESFTEVSYEQAENSVKQPDDTKTYTSQNIISSIKPATKEKQGYSMVSIGTPDDLKTQYGIISSSVFLDDFQTDFLIRASQMHQNSKTITAPKAMTLDGETAAFTTTKNEQYFSGYSDSEGLQTDSFEKGIGIELKPDILSGDEQKVKLHIYFTFTDIIGYKDRTYKNTQTYKIPVLKKVEINTETTVPDRSTLLIFGPEITPSIKDDELPDSDQTPQKLLILIKPIIIDPTQT